MNNRAHYLRGLLFGLGALMILLQTTASADSSSWTETIRSVKKTIVFLGTNNEMGQPEFYATASLIQVNGIYHLLTAKHVVMEIKEGHFTGQLRDERLVAYFNKSDGTIGQRRIVEIKKEHGVEWVFHPDVNVDLALLPFGIDVKNNDVLSIPDTYFLKSTAINELMDVFFASFQPGLVTRDLVRPVYRTGTVAILLVF